MSRALGIEARDRRRAMLLTAPALVWTLVFFVLPFALMAAISLWQATATGMIRTWSLDNYTAFFTRPAYLGAALNSIEITVTVTVLSVLLAYPMAWIIAEEVPRRYQRLALTLAVIPFWTSYIVRSYAWSLVLSRKGVVNDWLAGWGLPLLDLANSRAAVVIGFTHFFTMLLVLTIYASLVQLPPNLRRAAADLGAGPVAIFRHVVLPLTLPGVMVGAFLTFALCIGDYVTPQILGGGKDLALPQLVMLQVGRRADLPMASALSIVLMALVTLAYLAMARWMKEPGK
ncbi:MAG: ABC transporter permease subunit [Limimaricola sp.]|uniref:ABC transporter permease n=1 Tax=Limimaricola sp. TaxID=2211665 RepID=UPI001D277E5F|nr:ABC transporter permease [Limimaricola sp.]MBI1416411.1 ABC transporter permease subunit [Limimaricola sp.]